MINAIKHGNHPKDIQLIRMYCTAVIDFTGEHYFNNISDDAKWLAREVASIVNEKIQERQSPKTDSDKNRTTTILLKNLK